MTFLLWKAGFRYLTHHPWQLGLAVLGVALGVAVVVSVDIATETSRRSFALSTELVAGDATHRIVAGPAGVPEELYRRVRVGLGVRSAAPMVEGTVAIGAAPRTVLRVLASDVFANPRLRRDLSGSGALSGQPLGLLTRPGAVVLPRAVAEELALEVGQAFELLAGSGPQQAYLTALWERSDLGRVMLADIATAQELFAMVGRLSHIDLTLADDASAKETIAAIERILPPGTRLERSKARNRAVAELAQAFHLNLTAMSLLALLVGLFLIYNSMTFSVVQRRALFGRLRALGVSRRELFTLIIGEAILLGGVGTLLGLLLGTMLGQGLIDLVTRTINDLYYTISVRSVHTPPISLLKGFALGLGVTLVAGWLPAREAAAALPANVMRRSDLEHKTHRAIPGLALAGLVLLGGGAALLLVSGRSITLGFLGLFALIVACTLLCPAMVLAFARASQWLAGIVLGSMGRMAGRNLGRHLSRTGVAIAALMVAISATVGVGIMVDSFRASVAIWLDDVLNADLYVAPVTIGTGDSSAIMQPSTLDALRALPEVAGISTYRRTSVLVDDRLASLIAVDLTVPSRAGYRFVGDDPGRAWASFDRDQAVLISEPFAYHHGLRTGDSVALDTPSGPQRFEIAGVFRDYGSEHGRINLRPELYRRYWRDPAIGSSAVFAATGADLETLARTITEGPGGIQPLLVTNSREIRRQSLEVFDRTFTITNVLRLLAVIVAFVGVLSAVLAMLLDRSRELSVLRANGMTTGDIARLLTLENGILGAAAGLLALPTGLLLAGVLVFVINRRAFGWTMDFHVSPDILWQALLLSVTAALLAGVYPAWRAGRSSPAAALREE